MCRLVRGLGTNGVIRVGGITSDSASFAPDAVASSSAAKSTVINAANLRELDGFLDATGWRLIWGLNLGSGDMENAAKEAVAVAAAVKDKLLAFEIGNEPDGFAGDAFNAHRPKNYGYDDYLKEYRAYKAVIRSKLPDAPFAGPDASWATGLGIAVRRRRRQRFKAPDADITIGPAPIIRISTGLSVRASGQTTKRAAKNNKIELLTREDTSLRGMLQELSTAASARMFRSASAKRIHFTAADNLARAMPLCRRFGYSISCGPWRPAALPA